MSILDEIRRRIREVLSETGERPKYLTVTQEEAEWGAAYLWERKRSTTHSYDELPADRRLRVYGVIMVNSDGEPYCLAENSEKGPFLAVLKKKLIINEELRSRGS